jgi:hypothetical protein
LVVYDLLISLDEVYHTTAKFTIRNLEFIGSGFIESPVDVGIEVVEDEEEDGGVIIGGEDLDVEFVNYWKYFWYFVVVLVLFLVAFFVRKKK